MAAGRPKKTTADFPKFEEMTWQQKILKEMSEGASLHEVKAMLDISNTTHTRLMAEDKQYSETIKKGMRLCRQWWESQGRKSLQHKDFNATLWYMNMKNRFKWTDRQDITSDSKKLETTVVVLPPNGREKNS